MTKLETEIIVKPSEAARRIGISTPTLHAWRKLGRILMVGLPNGRYGVPVSEIERLQQRLNGEEGQQ
jgi:predicted site-specific integrase-resolvase